MRIDSGSGRNSVAQQPRAGEGPNSKRPNAPRLKGPQDNIAPAQAQSGGTPAKSENTHGALKTEKLPDRLA